jgi:Cytochrome c oxidase subunit IV
MRFESWVLILLGVFYGIIGGVYWVWSRDATGGVLLVGGLLLGLLPGLYLLWWYRHSGKKPRLEDDPNASIEQGAGVIDAFPDRSIWPFVFASGCFFGVLALVFGTWFAVPGIGLGLLAMAGFTAESRRGGAV